MTPLGAYLWLFDDPAAVRSRPADSRGHLADRRRLLLLAKCVLRSTVKHTAFAVCFAGGAGAATRWRSSSAAASAGACWPASSRAATSRPRGSCACAPTSASSAARWCWSAGSRPGCASRSSSRPGRCTCGRRRSSSTTSSAAAFSVPVLVYSAWFFGGQIDASSSTRAATEHGILVAIVIVDGDRRHQAAAPAQAHRAHGRGGGVAGMPKAKVKVKKAREVVRKTARKPARPSARKAAREQAYDGRRGSCWRRSARASSTTPIPIRRRRRWRAIK